MHNEMSDQSMQSLFPHIQAFSNYLPQKIALCTDKETLSYLQLLQLIKQTMQYLSALSPKVVALYAENSPAWVVVDLACQELGICLLPLPTFFSSTQLQHAIKASAADVLLIDSQQDKKSSLTTVFTSSPQPLQIVTQTFSVYSRPRNQQQRFPKNTGKITFTSGSTGTPKGVCLSNQHILSVALSLKNSLQLSKVQHLSLLPLSSLLENIAGIYIPLLAGGKITLLPAKQTGLSGSSQLNIEKLLSCLNTYKPESLILIPELLRALIEALRQGFSAPESLKFIAVGGAKVAKQLIQDALKRGLPVYEGYGLSECASVLCVNTPQNKSIGSVGKPLSHTKIVIREGEIFVRQPIFLGYLNQLNSWHPKEFATGDLGYQDEHDFIHINGRKKNIMISSFGRNISPEWLESELLTYFSQAIVFGDQQTHCIALISPLSHKVEIDKSKLIQEVMTKINQNLPDYAHIKQWLILDEPFSIQNGLLTETGKPKRAAIDYYYHAQIKQLYTAHSLLN